MKKYHGYHPIWNDIRELFWDNLINFFMNITIFNGAFNAR